MRGRFVRHRGVAQLGSAFGSGPKGRGFESRHFDTINPLKCKHFEGFSFWLTILKIHKMPTFMRY